MIGADRHHVAFASARDGSSTAYSSIGAGHALVHLPVGPFFTREMSIELLSQNASAALPALRHVFYDHRAVGLSGGATRDFSLDAQVDDLHAVVGALDERSVHIVAALNSAPAAVAYAVRRPERVSSLTLWVPYLRGRDFHAVHSIEARRALAEADWPMFLQTLAMELFGWDGGARAARYTELLNLVISRETVIEAVRAQAETDVTALISQLRTPVLVVHPRGVDRPPASMSARLVESIEQARLVLPNGKALLPFLSDHEAVGRAISHLIAGATERTGITVPASDGARLPSPRLNAGLSARESEVLTLVASGKTNKQIANDLTVTVGTVKRHTHNIYAKLNVGRRIEAVSMAQSMGLLEPVKQRPFDGGVREPQPAQST